MLFSIREKDRYSKKNTSTEESIVIPQIDPLRKVLSAIKGIIDSAVDSLVNSRIGESERNLTGNEGNTGFKGNSLILRGMIRSATASEVSLEFSEDVFFKGDYYTDFKLFRYDFFYKSRKEAQVGGYISQGGSEFTFSEFSRLSA